MQQSGPACPPGLEDGYGKVRAESPQSFRLPQHCLPALSPPGPPQPWLPTSALPACAGRSLALDSLLVHRLPGSEPPDAVPAAPGPSAAQPAAAPPAAAAPRPTAGFLGGEWEEEGWEMSVGNRSLVGGQGPGKGIVGA